MAGILLPRARASFNRHERPVRRDEKGAGNLRCIEILLMRFMEEAGGVSTVERSRAGVPAKPPARLASSPSNGPVVLDEKSGGESGLRCEKA